ncbi:MucBP domain-containing protein, partial [Streptococcus sp. 544]|uniref:MucBP domain-containing protein n=1 Tax=Streptococcus sp. 544 TaxID=2582640 RepID=UPI001F04AE62
MSNKKEIFSIRKLKNGRSDSVKIGTLGLIMGAAIALSVNTQSVEAAIIDNGDGTTTISNSKGSITVDTAHVKIESDDDDSKDFDPNPKPNETGTDNITKIGKVDYKYVSTDGTVLEEDQNQDAGFEKQISVDYEVYGKYGKVFKSLKGNEITDTDLTKAKEHGAVGKDTIVKNNTTYHKIGDPAVEITGDGGGVYSDSTLGNVTAKLTSEGLVQKDGKINHSGVKPGGRSWIVEETGKGTYGKYVLADTPATTSDKWLEDTFKAGEATAKDYTSTNIAADGGVKEGDYVFVLEKNTFVTASRNNVSYTQVIEKEIPQDINDIKGLYSYILQHKDNPDTVTIPGTKTLLNDYLKYLQRYNLADTESNFKSFFIFGNGEDLYSQDMAAKLFRSSTLDSENRPAGDVKFSGDNVDFKGLSIGGGNFYANATVDNGYYENYNYKIEYTPLRAYRLGSGHTTITYTYSPEVTSRVEKKGSVTVHYQTEDGTTLKDSYKDTVDAVVEVETKTYYLDANNQEVVVNTSKNTENVTYNTKENDTEKPQRLEANGSVYYIKENGTKTTVNGVPQTSPAEEGPVVEGTTEVTYVYEKAGSVVIKYINTDGTEIKTSVQDSTNVKAGTAYNAAENDEKPATIEFNNKKYKLVTKAGTTTTNATYSAEAVVTNGENVGTVEGQVVAGKTLEVTYVYEEVKGNVLVKYVDEKGTPLAGTATMPGNTTEAVTADGVKAVTEAGLGTRYDNKVAEKKATKITTADGKVYELVKENNGLYNTSAPETGTVTEADKVVTFVYKEKKSAVNVKYVDKAGQPIAGTATMPNNSTEEVTVDGLKPVTDASVNSDYDVTSKKASKITTADGKVYRLIGLQAGSKPAAGTVEENEITVTYQYELLGSVVTKYELSDGTKLTGALTFDSATTPTTVEDKGLAVANATDVSNGTNYDASTSANKPNKITTAAGEVYYLTTSNNGVKADSAPVTGTVEEGKTKEVTYVYEKAGSVVIKYINTDGTEIKTSVQDSTNVKAGTVYNAAENDEKPATIEFNNTKYKLVTKAGTTTTNATYSAEAVVTNGENVGAASGEVVAGKTLEVTYVYTEVTGDVVVHYVDTEGNVIAEDKEDTKGASLNAKYDTTDNKPEKIEKAGIVYYLTEKALKDGSKPEEGLVVEGTTEVTYVYEKAGSVVVHYTDQEGNPISGTDPEGNNVPETNNDTTDGRPGTEYNTADNGMKPNRIKTAEGKVYELVPASTIGNETGKVVAGDTVEVTYVYKEVKGNVVVKYEDTEGNVIAEDEKDETDASLNVKYDTTDHKKDEITKDGVKYYLTAKALKDGSKETGYVVEGTTEVTYVYEKAGQVVVHYTDEKGNTIQVDAVDTKDGKPNSDYNTSDNGMKPTRITTAEGKVYKLVEASTKGNETGKVVAGETTEVTYVYKEVTGDVVVHYVDTEGNVIAEDKEDTKGASLNAKYDTTDNKPEKIEKDETVYYLTEKALKDGSKPENGDVVEGTTEVTYVYEKAGQVVVHYTDEKGNTIQVDAVDTKDGKPNSDYNTADNDMKPNRITTPEGKVYELVDASTKGNETGKVVAGETTEVTYVYKEVTGDVVVHYVDTEGNVIAEDKEDTKGASLNAKYDTTDNKPEKIEKDGTVYYLTEKALKDGSKETGDVVEGKTEVTYVYEKAGQVVVHYTDEKGNTIQVDAVDTKDGKPNSDYNTSDNGMKPTRITTAEGKVYKLVEASTKGNETGKVVAGQTLEVTYVYQEAKGNVIVKFQDTEGNPIADDENDETNASLNTNYNTSEHKKATIVKDGVTYYLTDKVLKDGSKPEEGTVVEGTTEVTYVYEKAGSVLVHYVDTEGNPLQGTNENQQPVTQTVTDTDNAKAGSDYDTQDHKPTSITTAEGKVYKLVPQSTRGNETGKVIAGQTLEVTYVYILENAVPEPKPEPKPE